MPMIGLLVGVWAIVGTVMIIWGWMTIIIPINSKNRQLGARVALLGLFLPLTAIPLLLYLMYKTTKIALGVED